MISMARTFGAPTSVPAGKVAAKKASVGIVSHWILNQDGQPGYVYLDNSPICESDYKSAKIARDCYAKAKGAQPAEQERASNKALALCVQLTKRSLSMTCLMR